MSENSLILGLPYIQAAQAQKHVTHNEALRTLDAIVQLGVKDDQLSTPPVSAQEGDRYIVGPSAVADWAAQDGTLSVFEAGQWVFFTPQVGWTAWVEARAVPVVFDGSAWQLGQADVSTLEAVERFGLNASSTSAATPFIVRAPNALWDNIPPVDGGSGSMIQSMNRAGTTTDIGLSFQTDYSTRAIFGLFGTDDLRLAVSPDGVTFKDVFRIDPATGIASQPSRPRFKGTTNFDNFVSLQSWTTIAINTMELNEQGAFDAGMSLFTAPVAGSYLLGSSLVFKQDQNASCRMHTRLLKNGVDVISGSFGEISGPHKNDLTVLCVQTFVALEVGDTVALQSKFRIDSGYIKADDTAFWGFLVP